MSSGARRGPALQPQVPADPYEDDWYETTPQRRRFVTPTRVFLVLLLIGSGAVAVYGVFFDRTPLQIPLAVSGLAVFGTTLIVLALVAARAAARLGRDGAGGKAVLAALFGGLCAFGAAGSLAAALVLGILVVSF